MRLKRTGILTKIVIAVLFVYALVSLIRINDRKADAQTDLEDLRHQESVLAAENDAMRNAIENSDDPSVLEGIARDQGYTYPNEEIYSAG